MRIPFVLEQTENKGIVNASGRSSVLAQPSLQLESGAFDDAYGSNIEMQCVGGQTIQAEAIERVGDERPDCLARNPAPAVLSSQPVSKFSVVSRPHDQIVDPDASREPSLRASDCKANLYSILVEERQPMANPPLR